MNKTQVKVFVNVSINVSTPNRRFLQFLRSEQSLSVPVPKRVQLDLNQCAHHLGNCIQIIFFFWFHSNSSRTRVGAFSTTRSGIAFKLIFPRMTKKCKEVMRLRQELRKYKQHYAIDKPARLSFSCSLDLLLNDIDQTNINRDIRDGNWLSTLGR